MACQHGPPVATRHQSRHLASSQARGRVLARRPGTTARGRQLAHVMSLHVRQRSSDRSPVTSRLTDADAARCVSAATEYRPRRGRQLISFRLPLTLCSPVTDAITHPTVSCAGPAQARNACAVRSGTAGGPPNGEASTTWLLIRL